jgi:hypothetical protein
MPLDMEVIKVYGTLLGQALIPLVLGSFKSLRVSQWSFWSGFLLVIERMDVIYTIMPARWHTVWKPSLLSLRVGAQPPSAVPVLSRLLTNRRLRTLKPS